MIWVVWKLFNHTKTPLSMLLLSFCILASSFPSHSVNSIRVSVWAAQAHQPRTLVTCCSGRSISPSCFHIMVASDEIGKDTVVKLHAWTKAIVLQVGCCTLKPIPLHVFSGAQAIENLTQHLYAATSGGSFGPATFVAGQDRQRDGVRWEFV